MEKDQEELNQKFLLAAAKGEIAEVERLLDEGADVNAHGNWDNTTALIEAAYHGHERTVKMLVERGADVNASNKYLNTALVYASKQGYIEVASTLLTVGARINIAGYTTALIEAVNSGHQSMVELLIKHGADLDIKTDKFSGTNQDNDTALIRASRKGYKEIVKLLISSGAKINRQDHENNTVLIKAVQKGH